MPSMQAYMRDRMRVQIDGWIQIPSTHARAHTQGWAQGQGETGQEEEAGAEQTRKTPQHGADKADATAPTPGDARSLLMQRNLRRLAEV